MPRMNASMHMVIFIGIILGGAKCSPKEDDGPAFDAFLNFDDTNSEQDAGATLDGQQYTDDTRSKMQTLQNKLNSTTESEEGPIHVAIPVSGSSTKRCNSGWYYFGGSCYRIVTWCKRDYGGASKYCNRLAHGARLVSISYQQEFDFLVPKLKRFYTGIEWKTKFWTSGTRNSQGIWYWNNKGNKEPFTTGGLWLPGEPNNNYGEEECISLIRNHGKFGLNDEARTLQSYFICEKTV